MQLYLFAILGTIIESFSDTILKIYTKNNKILFLITGLLGYAITGLMFTQLLKYHDLAKSNIIWHIIHFIILFLVSVFYFNKKYTYLDLIGILFGIISFIFLSRNGHSHH